jgi:hypothetical protein
MPPDRAVEQLVDEPPARDQQRRGAAEPERGALGPLFELIDGGGRHADLRRRNLHRPVGGEGLEKVALEPRRPVIAAGGGDMRGVVRGVIHRFVLLVSETD